MTKVDLRRRQVALQRRYIVVFILIAFVVGLLVAWVFPGIVVRLLSITLLVMAVVVFETRIRWSGQKSVKRLPRVKEAAQ